MGLGPGLDWLTTFAIGIGHFRLGFGDLAREKFQIVINAKPQSEYVEASLIMTAMTFVQDGNTNEARKKLEQVLQEYPNGKFKHDAEELLKRLKEVQHADVPALQ